MTDPPGVTGRMAAIKWAYRHHVLGAESFDTLDQAVAAAYWAAEHGEEALECIEVINDDGTVRVYSRDEVDALTAPLRQQQEERYRARPPIVAVLDLCAPDGKTWTPYENFTDMADAEVAAENARQLLGADRVELRPYGRKPLDSPDTDASRAG